MTESRSLNYLLNLWQEAVIGTPNLQPPSLLANDVRVANLVEHTGEVTQGSLFVARVRTGTDGHPYVPQAIQNGARVIVGQKELNELDFTIPNEIVYLKVNDTAEAMAWLAAAWHGFPGRHIRIIGITGTNGKTTTSAILFGILRAAGLRCGLISTIQAVFGDKEEPTGLHVTTPGAPQLQEYLRRMVDAGLTHCILETTSHGLAQHRVTGVSFEMGLVTNVTHEHIDYHGTFNNYLAAKRRLFDLVSQHANGVSILNSDDANSIVPFSNASQGDIITYGQFLLPNGSKPNVFASNVQFSAEATQFELHLPNQTKTYKVKTILLGQFNISNILCAAATADRLGISGDQIVAGVKQVTSISGRMERIDEGQAFLTIVDFAHTPDALENAIDAAKTMRNPDGRIITVFGSAGKRDIEKRRLMAEISARSADITILTAEDPRTESLDDILEMMASGCRSQGKLEGIDFWRVPDRGQAIFFAISLAQSEDIVLICGKGHEQSMCFGQTEYPWDDRNATRTAIQAFLKNKTMPSLGLPTEASLRTSS
ncbi:MAG: UDP-N-acetylmuramoyl-L-alanyl-D-glutamate--2,6-diaminopimelate ligase [Chloroflexota bacterium]